MLILFHYFSKNELFLKSSFAIADSNSSGVI
jgi:hypothetical protein